MGKSKAVQSLHISNLCALHNFHLRYFVLRRFRENWSRFVDFLQWLFGGLLGDSSRVEYHRWVAAIVVLSNKHLHMLVRELFNEFALWLWYSTHSACLWLWMQHFYLICSLFPINLWLCFALIFLFWLLFRSTFTQIAFHERVFFTGMDQRLLAVFIEIRSCVSCFKLNRFSLAVFTGYLATDAPRTSFKDNFRTSLFARVWPIHLVLDSACSGVQSDLLSCLPGWRKVATGWHETLGGLAQLARLGLWWCCS